MFDDKKSAGVAIRDAQKTARESAFGLLKEKHDNLLISLRNEVISLGSLMSPVLRPDVVANNPEDEKKVSSVSMVEDWMSASIDEITVILNIVNSMKERCIL